jgi:hypothetical protein
MSDLIKICGIDKKKTEIKEVSYEEIFPTKPGEYYLDRFGIYCTAYVEGSKAVIMFDCGNITGGKILRELTRRMLGVEFGIRRINADTLKVSIDSCQFSEIDRRVKTNYKGELVRY